MVLHIHSGWDHADVGTAYININDSGAGNVVLTFSSGTNAHKTFTAGSVTYATFLSTLITALNAATGANYSSSTFTASATKLQYQITRSTGTFQIIAGAGGTATNTLGKNLIGLATDTSLPTSAAATWVSDATASYSLIGAMGGLSNVSDDYEAPGIVSGAYADGGQDYAIAATSGTTFFDFTIQFEAKAKTFSRDAPTSDPWTHEDFVKHVRSDTPFLVDGAEESVHRLRPESAIFKPQRVTADFDDHWHHTYNTYLLGRS